MHIFAAILALAAERFLPLDPEWRQPERLIANADWFKRRLIARGGVFDGVGGVLALVLLPALLVSMIADTIDGWLFGLFDLAFAGVVLMYSLGPVNQAATMMAIDEALAAGDEPSASRRVREIIAAEPPPRSELWSRFVARSAVMRANDRLIAPLFWFLLVGPVGAVVYRTISIWRDDAEATGFRAGARTVHAWLAWLPARILAGAYALVGRFDEVLSAWSVAPYKCAIPDDDAAGLCLCTGCAALGIEPQEDPAAESEVQDAENAVIVMPPHDDSLHFAMSLLDRVQMLVVALLALFMVARIAA
ncbi:MAG: regulatory signaling modulator protein AmpE [Gammaproteobacteria bacterium]|nr:regulatory signaling modulator protein AmpE [Gammaproteobacteria bacterium]MCP5137120.1 regulatory signaling modulator protein AmpE [Gammaproteobacteria bacterium]